MAFTKPLFSKSQINKAGDILKVNDWMDLVLDEGSSLDEYLWASDVLANFRACHSYPINTFNVTLRDKLRSIDKEAIVAQRLKRTPSIILKLRRFDGMQLARMQDIGGLRAVCGTVRNVQRLAEAYQKASFKHELVSLKNYIEEPKADGYRSLHLIYRYHNKAVPVYNGLSLELQVRTKLQHAWATSVETMGTFLGQALKSGQGEGQWRRFFEQAGAALAILEKTSPVPGFEGKEPDEVCGELADTEKSLRVLEKLRGLSIAAKNITRERGHGAYHLIILDSESRKVTIRPYSIARLEQANADYADIEQKSKAGRQIEAVLVSAGPIRGLRKAYPNYFLDTQEFIKQIETLIRPSLKSIRR